MDMVSMVYPLNPCNPSTLSSLAKFEQIRKTSRKTFGLIEDSASAVESPSEKAPNEARAGRRERDANRLRRGLNASSSRAFVRTYQAIEPIRPSKMSKKVNTLFNYFSKSPKVDATSGARAGGGGGGGDGRAAQSSPISSKTGTRSSQRKPIEAISTSPSPSTSGKSPKLRQGLWEPIKKAENKEKAKAKGRGDGSVNGESVPEPFDLVWAKLEGFPFWPSIVCHHPTSCETTKRKNSCLYIHVQFFDDPPQRSWIKANNTRPYTGPSLRGQNNNDTRLLMAIEFAEEALKMEKTQRMGLIVDLKPSDDEAEPEIISIDDNFEQDVLDDVASDHGREEDQQDEEEEGQRMQTDEVSVKRRRASKGNVTMSEIKRRKVAFISDSEDEFKPLPGDEASSSDISSGELSADNLGIATEEEEEEVKAEEDNLMMAKSSNTSFSNGSKSKALPSKAFSRFTGSKGSPRPNATKARLSAFAADKSFKINDCSTGESREWPHLSYDFLLPDKIRDMNKNRPNNPEYDSKTLYVPPEFLRKKEVTSAQQQWWKLKAQHFDAILFFKVGKFYELFHMDAVIGAQELNLLYMKGKENSAAHVGFPEKTYQKFSDQLLWRGYKVARVEQTETPEMKDERCKKMAGPKDKVVTREICRVTTPGTRTCSVLDAEPSSAQSLFLLAVAEEVKEDCQGIKSTEYGVCFIDTLIGKFHLGQFKDDRHCSRLRTLIAHHPPGQLLTERGRVTSSTQKTFENCLPAVLRESLKPEKEFWGPLKTLKHLREEAYFKDENGDHILPLVLKKMISENDCLQQTSKQEYQLAIKALGATVWYLKHCLIDEELLTMRQFEEYLPSDEAQANAASPNKLNTCFMVIDSVTLKNLEVFENSVRGTKGTLFETMNYCSTKFGQRLLRYWICAPLVDVPSINSRLDAVQDLRKLLVDKRLTRVISILQKLPDLERLLSKIHAQGCSRRSQTHPDSRAILFEAKIYSKRKIVDFITIIESYRNCHELVESFSATKDNFLSDLLRKCVSFQEDGGRFPNMMKTITHFETSFNHETAKKEGRIIPKKGKVPEYDEALAEVNQVEDKLEKYLQKQNQKFGCKIKYVGTGKTRYQLEMSDNAAKRAGGEYECKGNRKGFKRYYTQDIKKLLSELEAAEEKKEKVLEDLMRIIFANFDKNYDKWLLAVNCLALIDCLISLAKTSEAMKSHGSAVCRPTFVENEKPFVRVKKGKHPCLLKYCDNYIDNDLKLGDELMIINGPNMGGKSTIMRQTGLIAVMSQIGCFVPAEEVTLTPVDRVFTRLGASDRILEGESTFFVELSETCTILRHATRHSLVLLDELGRGTSTFDGTAIACSVVDRLASETKCRTLFSTHYHSLVDEFAHNTSVSSFHMACQVEKEEQAEEEEEGQQSEHHLQETITFLYKLEPGSCPRSYGFNAAKLAGIPIEIVRSASERASRFERHMNSPKLLRSLFQENQEVVELRKIIEVLKLD